MNLFHLQPDQINPKPKIPPNPFWYPPDEEGREYSKPALDWLTTAGCLLLLTVIVAGVGCAILHHKGLL